MDFDLRRGVLEVADGGEGGVVEGFVFNEFAQRAFALRHLGGDVERERLHVGNRDGERVFVGVDEIPERPDQRVNLEAGEALGEVLDAGGHVVNLLHHGAQVGLLGGGHILVVLEGFALRRAEVHGDEVLPQQPGEFNRRDAVGLHLRRGAHFHHDQDFIVGELDVLHPPDFHARHLDPVADLEVLHVAEEGVDMLAGLEALKAAHSFQNDRAGQHGQGHEKSNTRFQGVFHTLMFLGSKAGSMPFEIGM